MLSGLKIKPKRSDGENTAGTSTDNLQRESWMTDVSTVAISSSFTKQAPVKPADINPARPNPIDLATVGLSGNRPMQVGDGGVGWRRRIKKRQRERQQVQAESASTSSSSILRRPKSKHPLLASEYMDRKEDEDQDHTEDCVSTTADDLNQLAAEALRAQLSGDLKKHDAIQRRIESARSKPRIEIIPDVDHRGRPVNLNAPDRDNVKCLAQQEKLQAKNQFQNEFAQEIARNPKFSTSTDEQFDTCHIDMFDQTSKKSKQVVDNEQAKRKNMVSNHRKFQTQIDNCLFCLEGRRIDRHLVVSCGQHCYISLPPTPPLGLGHCYIVPSSHSRSVTEMDDSVYEEVQAVKQQLVKMFESVSQKVIFMETRPSRPQHHAVIECIPMDDEMYIDAPIYFKKGLLDADEEWSSHKKIIEISRQKSIRMTIPAGFPYFCVEFGIDGFGYAHVIEDERKFSGRFGQQIVCGLLQEHPQMVFWAKPESRELQVERVNQFRELWSRFDCLVPHI